MKTCKSTIQLIAVVGLAATAPLYSTTIAYSSRTTWQGAVSGVVTTTFDASAPGYTPPPAGTGISLPFGGITLNGVTFQGFNATEYSLQIATPGPNSQYFNWGTGGAILYGDLYQGSLSRLHISLPTAVTAWGVDLMLGNTPGGTYNVQVNGSTVCPAQTCQAPTFAFPTAAFYGMTSDTPFTSIDLFYPVNTYAAIDNFSTATTTATQTAPADTPEAATLLLCASGLIAMAKVKKRGSLLTA